MESVDAPLGIGVHQFFGVAGVGDPDSTATDPGFDNDRVGQGGL